VPAVHRPQHVAAGGGPRQHPGLHRATLRPLQDSHQDRVSHEGGGHQQHPGLHDGQRVPAGGQPGAGHGLPRPRPPAEGRPAAPLGVGRAGPARGGRASRPGRRGGRQDLQLHRVQQQRCLLNSISFVFGATLGALKECAFIVIMIMIMMMK